MVNDWIGLAALKFKDAVMRATQTAEEVGSQSVPASPMAQLSITTETLLCFGTIAFFCLWVCLVGSGRHAVTYDNRMERAQKQTDNVDMLVGGIASPATGHTGG